MKFMFDTNAIDKISEHWEEIKNSKANHEYYVTYVQMNELREIPDFERQNSLKYVVLEMTEHNEETTLFVIGKTPIGSGRIGGGDTDSIYESVKNDNPRHIEDALIAEAVIFHSLILITNDKRLTKKIQNFEGQAISFEKFLDYLAISKED